MASYKQYILAKKCSVDKVEGRFVFDAVREEKIEQIYTEKNIENSTLKMNLDKISNPIIQEYALNEIHIKNKKEKNKEIIEFNDLEIREIKDLLKKNKFYINNEGMTLQEYAFWNGISKWEINDSRFRINYLALQALEKDIKNHMSKIVKSKNLLDDRHSTKNIIYYLIANSTTVEELKIITEFGTNPISVNGLNIYEEVYLKTKYDKKYTKILKYLETEYSFKKEDIRLP